MLWVGQASESFEPPYFERSNLPFPPLDLRLVRQTLCNSCAFQPTYFLLDSKTCSSCSKSARGWVFKVGTWFGWQALVSAQLLVYGQNEDPGPDLADLYWKTYVAKTTAKQPSNFG